MKKTIFLLSLVLWSFSVSGQFILNSSTNDIYNSNTENVGVGISTPQAKLHAKSAIVNSVIDEFGNETCSGLSVFRIEGTSPGYVCENQTGSFGNYLEVIYNENNIQTTKILFDQAGKVGIGDNITPITPLDVDGKITMRQNAISGYVPVSDANGTMTWTDPNTLLSNSNWTLSGGDIYNNNSGDVIIGSQTKKNGY